MHPHAKPDQQPPAPVTGIDYLALVRDRHTEALAQRVNYAALTAAATTMKAAAISADRLPVLPGQTDLLELLDPTTPALHDDPDHRELS